MLRACSYPASNVRERQAGPRSQSGFSCVARSIAIMGAFVGRVAYGTCLDAK